MNYYLINNCNIRQDRFVVSSAKEQEPTSWGYGLQACREMVLSRTVDLINSYFVLLSNLLF